jgi:hypothetical protein
VGTGNLPLLTTGSKNVAIGTSTLASVTTGSDNFGFGVNTLFDLTTGTNNIAIGTGVAPNITSGADNICIAGNPLGATDVSSIAIGADGDGSSTTVIGRGGNAPNTQTRLIGNTLILGRQDLTTGTDKRTSIVQTAQTDNKTITLPNATGKVAVYTDTPAAGQVLTATDASGASTWETPASSTPTNAQVNTAISTNPLASRLAMAVPEQNINLTGVKNSIQIVNDLPLSAISAILLGDSFAATGALFNFTTMTRVVGSYRTGQLTGGGDSGLSTINDYTKCPSGNFYSIASGGNLTSGHLLSGQQGLASQAYYTFFTGTGTAQLQYKKGAGAWTNVGSTIDTTAITSVQIGTITLPDASSNYAVRVTATGGTVVGWIGQGMNGPGLTTMDFAVAGQNMESSATVTETIWKAMINGYKSSTGAQVVITAFADYRFTQVATSAWPTKGTPTWDVSGPAQTLYTWSRAQNSTVDWIVIGPHQVSTALTDSVDALVDAAFTAIGIGSNLNERTIDGARAQREFALYNNTGWCDNIYITDYVNGNAEGLYGDTIHFNAKGQNYKRLNLYKQTNIGQIFGSNMQYSALRIGTLRLSSTAIRVGQSSLIAYVISATETELAPITASALRVGDAITPEQSGMEFAWVSTNVARIRGYSSGGFNAYGVDFSYSGVGIVIRPSITASSLNGTSALPWETTFTQGLVLPPVAQTATTAAVSTVYVTTALTTTAPAQAITLANGVAGQIKIITHVATSGSGTAILTPATKTGYTTVTFTSVGDTVTMQYYTTIGWIITSIRGAVAA